LQYGQLRKGLYTMNEEITKVFESIGNNKEEPNKIFEGKNGKMIVHGDLNIDLIARYFLKLKQK
jgi:hypothetical protein